MTTPAPTTTRARRTPRALPGSRIPTLLQERLRTTDDPREHLVLIAEHERARLERGVAPLVGATNAEDVVSEVIVRHLERHLAEPGAGYADVEGYHRLRASLTRSVRNRAVDWRRRRSQVEMLVAGVGEHAPRGDVVDGGTPADERAAVIASLDAAALYDALRRLEPRDAEVLRVKLVEGRTFRELADHLGVRSLNAAHKHYLRAARRAQAALDRYGAGGYCRDYAPYLGLLGQERGGDPERPLTQLIGPDRAEEVGLHVWGDPDVPADRGCHACQSGGRRQAHVLAVFLPPAFVLAAPAGPLAAAAAVVRHGWDSVSAWATVAAGPTIAPGGGVATKGVALVAAATIAVAGPTMAGRVSPPSDRVAPAAAAGPARVADARAPARASVRPGPRPAAARPPNPVAARRASTPRERPASRVHGAVREFTPGP